MINDFELGIGNTIKQGTITSFYDGGVHVGGGNTCSFDEAEPIILTTDILDDIFAVSEHWLATYEIPCSMDKLYLRPSMYGWYWGFLQQNNHNGEVTDFELSDVQELKYAHELQNIYYAIEKKQLIIHINNKYHDRKKISNNSRNKNKIN